MDSYVKKTHNCLITKANNNWMYFTQMSQYINWVSFVFQIELVEWMIKNLKMKADKCTRSSMFGIHK